MLPSETSSRLVDMVEFSLRVIHQFTCPTLWLLYPAALHGQLSEHCPIGRLSCEDHSSTKGSTGAAWVVFQGTVNLTAFHTLMERLASLSQDGALQMTWMMISAGCATSGITRYGQIFPFYDLGDLVQEYHLFL